MKIIISGYGKMGKLLGKVLVNEELIIVDPKYSTVQINDIKDKYDVIIDFSHHSSINNIYKYMMKHPKTKLILGTTAHNENEIALIENLSKEHVVVKDSNFSLSMLIFKQIMKEINSFDLSLYDIKLYEKHNVSKKDIPSGTTKDILKIFNGSDVEVIPIRNKTKTKGIHKVIIENDLSKLTFQHEAKDRMDFVNGILIALKRINNYRSGLHTFEDITYNERIN